MKFKTKPAEIEAFQYDGDFMGKDGYYVPQWAVDALNNGNVYWDELNGVPGELFIKAPTSVVDIHVALDDYIIKGTDGQLYRCSADVFEKTYEATGD